MPPPGLPNKNAIKATAAATRARNFGHIASFGLEPTMLAGPLFQYFFQLVHQTRFHLEEGGNDFFHFVAGQGIRV